MNARMLKTAPCCAPVLHGTKALKSNITLKLENKLYMLLQTQKKFLQINEINKINDDIIFHFRSTMILSSINLFDNILSLHV